MPVEWQTNVQYIRGVGPKRAAILEKVGIRTVEDLLFHLPTRYEDRSQFQKILEMYPGEPATLRVRISNPAVQKTRRRGMSLFRAIAEDDSGAVPCVWFNQPFLKDILTPGREVLLFGSTSVEKRTGRLQLENPYYELIETDEETIHTGRVVPIHQRVGAVRPKAMRGIVYEALSQMEDREEDPLPPEIRSRRQLLPRLESFRKVHFPDTWNPDQSMSPALRRLAYEELFLLELGLLWRRKGADEEAKAKAYKPPGNFEEAIQELLPFQLTHAQSRTITEIVANLGSTVPMHRLLQGDVGSGKTAVALLAMWVVAIAGGQALLMAPTELLAEQHYRNLRKILDPAGITVGLLTASLKAAERRALLATVSTGMTPLLVGTHALLTEDLIFKDLGLVVIDEQHRFGVLQRAGLQEKESRPHSLVMTATPIPRSLALTLYGDLDLSIIDELPPGRKPVTTAVRDDSARKKVYAFLETEMQTGRQIYIVYPQVEESEESDLKAATEGCEHLQKRFPGRQIGLVHGRLPKEDRDEVMRQFREGEIDLLVATTVIEVGVDVPNASVMVVEHAERFGLSQLHQLRGRVGRGSEKSWCILMRIQNITPEAALRLDAMVQTQDGFRIAEVDLEIRGPGEFMGTKQSGLPPLRAANLIRDRKLLETAREDAIGMFQDGTIPPRLVRYLKNYWADRFGLFEVG